VLSSRLIALLRRVSRSFYLTIRVLPASVQGQVALGYLLARAADTVADTPLLPPADRAEVLQRLRAAVAGGDPASLLDRLRDLPAPAGAAGSDTARAEHELLQTLGECLALLRQLAPADQRLVQHVLAQLTHGMIVDLQRFPAAAATVPPEQVVALATRLDLDQYTYYAAGCVGEFWTDLMARQVPEMAPLADPELRGRGVSLGKALQLVNVIRDVPADLRAGRCYWPVELLAAHGLSPIALARMADPRAELPPLHTARAVRAATAELLTLAVQMCEAAWPYVRAIAPGPLQVRLRLACVWPLLLGLKTLSLLRCVGSPLLCGAAPVKVGRAAVYALMARSSLAAVLDGRDKGSSRLDQLFADAIAGAAGTTVGAPL
jgi:farnesyl-diphosphate farnesyltransferase